jgi:signal transduction histidine kinase
VPVVKRRRKPGPRTPPKAAARKNSKSRPRGGRPTDSSENARLRGELQAAGAALAAARNEIRAGGEQQAALAEILRAISTSPGNLAPVLDSLVASAARFCGAEDASIFQIDGDMLRLAAHHGQVPGSGADVRIPIVRGTVGGRSVLERRPVHVADVPSETDEFPEGSQISRSVGHRTILSVPLLVRDVPVGVIQLRRAEVRPFTGKQIELLAVFAEQAVVAIENVRLFTEAQASNHHLTAALDRQTVTSEILRIINRSQTDAQPVFQAIVESAVRLLQAYAGALATLDGDSMHLMAGTSTDAAGDAALREFFPRPLSQAPLHANAIRDGLPQIVSDATTDPRLPPSVHAYARVRGYRSQIVVPFGRSSATVGTLSVVGREDFSSEAVSVLEMFADQAVIAIENVRLFTELQTRTEELTRSVAQLTALGEVGRAVSSSLDLDTVLNTIVARAVQLSGTDGGTIFEYDETAEQFSARATLSASERQSALLRGTRVRHGEGVVGQIAVTREPFQIADIAAEGAYASRIRGAMLESGTRSVLAVPLLHEERVVGGLVVTRRVPGEFSSAVIDILRTFAIQSALAIQNARLFSQLESKSRELEVASRHKSEFLASMSHELRTPLNAIIGFSDVLLQGMFGETNEKQEEYLRDILSSGQHLLSLINDILDLSKIEAGRMDLELTEFHVPAAIDDALMLMRERAARRGQVLDRAIDPAVGHVRADERKFKQVLLNLLSNAVKFTPDGGRITVSAGVTNGEAIVSVTDTGVGIAPEHQDLVFEEFRQVGHADKKAEGTGLGLALCRKFIELHGGRIALTSELGKGATFTFALPLAGPPRSD